MKGFKLKSIIIIVILLLAYSGLAAWAVSYYSKTVPSLQGESYRQSSETANSKEFKHFGEPKLTVYNFEEAKVVRIGEFDYTVYKNSEYGLAEYTVVYPDGPSFIVKETNDDGRLLIYNIDGTPYNKQFSVSVVAYPNNNVAKSTDYSAASIVRIADESFYETRGYVKGFIWSFILFHIAVLVFVCEPIQLLLFHITHRLDVVDPEPTDFYFISTKFGCVVVGVVALYMMIMCI